MKTVITGIRSFVRNFAYALRVIMVASRTYFFLAIFFSILSGLYGVGQAVFVKRIIDELEMNGEFWVIALSAALILLGLLVNKIVSRLLMGLNRVVTDKVGYSLEKNILEAMDKVTVAQMDDPQFLNKLEQARNLVKNQPNSIFMNMFGIITELAGVIGYFAILLQFSWIAPLILIATALILFLVNNQYEENVMSFLFGMSLERRKMGYYSGLLMARENYEEIASYGSAGFFRAKYDENMQTQLKNAWSIFRRHGVRYVLAAILSYGGCAAIYLWILYRAYCGDIGIGSVTMLLSACVGIQGLCVELVDGCAILPSSLKMLQNYRSILNGIEEQSQKCAPVAPGKERCSETEAIVFENVSFSYPGKEEKVLANTSFSIEKNSTVALVGVNGAGKTTIVKLVLGLYDNYEGNIYINGVNARMISREERLQRLSVMFQNYIKPSVTLREAVTIGCAADTGRVAHALEQGGLKEEVDLETPLTKNFSAQGWIPSGGQWQKIALARMLLRDTDSYLLDEPSAALDPQAELELFRALEQLHGKKTILFITHRLTSIVDADEVLFLEMGGNVTKGTHQQLLRSSEEYSSLYRAQASRYTLG